MTTPAQADILDLFERAFPALDPRSDYSTPTRWLLGAPTPKEAPMPGYIHTDSDGDLLTVDQSIDTAGDRVAEVYTEDGRTAFVTKDDAPAVALAILEAAGIRPDISWAQGSSASSAVAYLKQHLADQAIQKARAEAKAAEAADAAKLDEEAQAIREAMIGDSSPAYDRRWADLNPHIQSEYRRAARAARELHGKA